MANALRRPLSFRQGDRVATIDGELGQIDAIRNSSALVRLDSGAVLAAGTTDLTLVAPSAFNSPRIDWRLIDIETEDEIQTI